MQHTAVTAEQLSSFLMTLEEHLSKHSKILKVSSPVLSVMKGRRYARIVEERQEQRSVYAFVDMSNGDLLLPATWKAPAKHARGNILDGTALAACGPFGVAYLR